MWLQHPFVKKLIISIIIIAAGLLIYGDMRNDPAPIINSIRYKSDITPLSFVYKVSDYIVREPYIPGQIESLVEALIVVPASEQAAVDRGERENSEYPAVIAIQIFRNPQGYSPQEWIENNPLISNITLKQGEFEEREVAGRPAIAYESEGLYSNQHIIFADKDLIYFLDGQYLDRDTDLYRDFEPLVDSIELE